jgi:hypothetical protein
MSKDLLYQPQIGYKKNYYTEGTFDDKSSDNSTPIIKEIPETLVINNLLDKTDKNLKWIPESIKNVYLSPYVALKDEYTRLLNSDTTPTVDPTPTPTIIPGNTDPDDDFPSDPFAKGPDIYIDIKDPLKYRSDINPLRYKSDFLDIYQDYLEKVSAIAENYMYSLLASLNMSDKNHNIKSYASKDVKNKNLLHLSDYLAKSNISLDQSVRLHKKLFDMDATILHVRGIRLAEALIERYFDIDKLNKENDLAVGSNVLLTESQRIADKKYKENFYALYKYLNSSVILMGESMNTLLKQNQSLLTINKYEERE